MLGRKFTSRNTKNKSNNRTTYFGKSVPLSGMSQINETGASSYKLRPRSKTGYYTPVTARPPAAQVYDTPTPYEPVPNEPVYASINNRQTPVYARIPPNDRVYNIQEPGNKLLYASTRNFPSPLNNKPLFNTKSASTKMVPNTVYNVLQSNASPKQVPVNNTPSAGSTYGHSNALKNATSKSGLNSNTNPPPKLSTITEQTENLNNEKITNRNIIKSKPLVNMRVPSPALQQLINGKNTPKHS